MATVSGWGELAGAAAGGPQAGTDAGGLRNSTGWQPSLAGFFAQPGRKPSRLGGAARGSVRRGLEGRSLGLILTDGCVGLAAAIRTVYPRVRHQRCRVHKMRNILEKARKCDYDEVKAGAQAIYLADGRKPAEAAFRAFRARWGRA